MVPGSSTFKMEKITSNAACVQDLEPPIVRCLLLLKSWHLLDVPNFLKAVMSSKNLGAYWPRGSGWLCCLQVSGQGES